MGFLSKLLGVQKGGGAAKPTPADLSAQRDALAARLMTPERAALIARALDVQRSKQAVLRELSDRMGQERMAEILRRMMDER